MERMRGHVDSGFSGEMSWDDVSEPWKKILEHVTHGRGIEIKLKQEEIPSYHEIMVEYMKEGIQGTE
jgi:hypothetical protein